MKKLKVDMLLGWMQPEMRERWEQAIKEKGETFDNFGAPYCAIDGLFFPYFCETCDVWHEAWGGDCYDVMDGEVYLFEWWCDCDDWDYSPVCKLDEIPDDYYDKRLEDAIRQEKEYHEATAVA